MVKNIFIFIYLLFTISCVRPNIPIDISGNVTVEEPVVVETPVVVEEHIVIEVPLSSYQKLMNVSEGFIVASETGGNNQNFTDPVLKQMLLKAGWKPSQAWCAYMVKGLLDSCDIPNKITGWSPTSYNKSDVIYTDGVFKKDYNDEDVIVMSLSYNKFKNDKSRYKGIGHTGIVEKVRTTNVITREGNTNDAGGRDGDGFYKKVRPLTKNLHITRYENTN
jgi:hypothetical protein